MTAMRWLMASLVAFGVVAMADGALAQKRPNEEQRIRDLDRDWVAKVAAKDLAGVVAFYAKDGVLMAPGRHNPAVHRIVSVMPQQEGPPVKLDTRIDPHALLPMHHGYYRYSGSLTTPPCSEVVQWLVMATPIHVAEADVARFAQLYPMNARPVQKLDRRYVLRSS